MLGILIGLAIGGLILLWALRCSGGADSGGGANDVAAAQTAAADALAQSFIAARHQMRNRIDMLDEMIDKADREIDAMQQRLAQIRIDRDLSGGDSRAA